MTAAAGQVVEGGRLDPALLRGVEEAGAALHTALAIAGERLGLYRALAGAGPLTPAELARRTGTAAPYVREWLNAHAAGGYVAYDPDSGRYALVEEAGPAVAGLCQLAYGAVRDAERVTEAVRGGGLPLAEHRIDVREGRERFLEAVCGAELLDHWLPALDGVVAKLDRGALVADVGCRRGAVTSLLAQAFPASRVVGFDPDPAAVAAARARDGRAEFQIAGPVSYSGAGYDLVTTFASLHETGDPAGAARHIRASLAPDGTWLAVEPLAGDRVEENLNPVGRLWYGLSALVSTPAALADEVGLALGAQAGEARIRELALAAGFSSFRRVADAPLATAFEARP